MLLLRHSQSSQLLHRGRQVLSSSSSSLSSKFYSQYHHLARPVVFNNNGFTTCKSSSVRFFHHHHHLQQQQQQMTNATVASANTTAAATATAAQPIVVETVLRSNGVESPVESTMTAEQEQEYRREYEKRARPVRIWLWTLSGLVFAIVAVGGWTRLEEGGLSMVTWSPLGSLPPMNQQQWEEEFERYKQFPEYQKKNLGMTLEEFKYIFWYEYLHRMLGRVIGVTFAVPAVIFASKGLISFKNTPIRVMSAGSALLIGSMIGFQGLLGWYMVKSGLDSDHRLMKEYNNVPRVSQYRLASHLLAAFAIYGFSIWKLMDVIFPKILSGASLYNSGSDPSILKRLRIMARTSPLLTALVFITAASGAFVAGMDAGLVYNEFPLMGGRLVPSDIFALSPKWKNFFENATAVQFQHRLLATVTSITIGSLYTWNRFVHKASWAALPPRVRLGLNAMMTVVGVQYCLGIATLLTYVPTSLASAHQMGSLTLFTVAIYFLHVMKRLRL